MRIAGTNADEDVREDQLAADAPQQPALGEDESRKRKYAAPAAIARPATVR